MLPGWVKSLFSRPETPRWNVVEVEKPVPVLDGSDNEAIALLKSHPGMIALLNRLRLQRVVLENQLTTTRQKDIHDANYLLARITGLRYVESQIREATNNLEIKRHRVASFDEANQFDLIMSSIEGVGTTNPE